MRSILSIILAGSLVLSASIATAETNEAANANEGFHALSMVQSQNHQALIALSDQQLNAVEGEGLGECLLTPNCFPILYPKPKFPSDCPPCGGVTFDTKDQVILPADIRQTVGYTSRLY